MDHYHEERPHQGLGNELIAPKITLPGPGPVRCRERLGGVLRFYYRQGQRKPGRGSRSDDMHPVALDLSCGAERAHPRQ
jgi:hypothetical protein